MDISGKIPVHVGLFGHIDSGKTAIAKVLSEVISTAGIDAHPQSKERGITIDMGFTSFILENYLVTLVDGPGHADLIKISASSVEIIDCAIVVIDINKGPQVQTGEHIIMIESLNIKNIIVALNKIDVFRGDLEEEIRKIKDFFGTTSYGSQVPIFPVSAKDERGFGALKEGLLKTINEIDITRDIEGTVVLPIDHHFTIKGRGSIVTGTILKGQLKINQTLHILPIGISGRVKNIQIFRQDRQLAKAGDRVGVNLKNVDVKRVFRGCIATDDKEAFEYHDILEIRVKKSKLFKPETHFGTQVHVTIGMFTTIGNLYPYNEVSGKKILSSASRKDLVFNAFLWLNNKILIRKERNTILISRLDLPPTTLRILGAAEVIKFHPEPPTLYKYKIKRGHVQNPDHSQGIICLGLAQSAIGAKKMIGRKLEPPFTRVTGTFGTKTALIVGIESEDINVSKGDEVLIKELRSFKLKPTKNK